MRYHATRKGANLERAPAALIEILYSEDRAGRIEDKIDDYLRFGVRHIWVITPKRNVGPTKRMATGNWQRYSTENPRIELPIDELFAELEGEIDLEEK